MDKFLISYIHVLIFNYRHVLIFKEKKKGVLVASATVISALSDGGCEGALFAVS